MIKINNREEYLQEVKKLINPNPICVEIGVFNGDFSTEIYDKLNPSKLYLIDPFNTMTDPITKLDYYPGMNHGTVYSNESCLNTVREKLKEPISENKVIIDRNLSTDALINYEDDFFDFIYIDACHLYESVLWDMENYFPKLKNGGLMGGHDYFNCPSFGVIKAVDHFCEKYGYEIIVLVGESQSGDWLLTPKKI
jgi:hypothetical protein